MLSSINKVQIVLSLKNCWILICLTTTKVVILLVQGCEFCRRTIGVFGCLWHDILIEIRKKQEVHSAKTRSNMMSIKVKLPWLIPPYLHPATSIYRWGWLCISRSWCCSYWYAEKQKTKMRSYSSLKYWLSHLICCIRFSEIDYPLGSYDMRTSCIVVWLSTSLLSFFLFLLFFLLSVSGDKPTYSTHVFKDIELMLLGPKLGEEYWITFKIWYVMALLMVQNIY